jgi:hypothetical protein
MPSMIGASRPPAFCTSSIPRSVDDRIVLWVYTEEALESVTHAVLRLAIPPERVAIRILRTWLDPYPDDPELSERLWKEQCRKWHIQDGTPDTGHEED